MFAHKYSRWRAFDLVGTRTYTRACLHTPMKRQGNNLLCSHVSNEKFSPYCSIYQTKDFIRLSNDNAALQLVPNNETQAVTP